jgi:phosphatidylserine decarboxylase
MKDFLIRIRKFRKEYLLFHKEGWPVFRKTIIYAIIINGILFFTSIADAAYLTINFLSMAALVFVLYIYRNPERIVEPNEKLVYAPVDGTIVSIGETVEHNYLNEPCILVSILVSLHSVHVNRVPVSGKVKYFSYNPGNNHKTWNPVSFFDNEYALTVLQTRGRKKIVIKQIAGNLCKHIVCYACENEQLQQGQELGFANFSSHVNVYLPALSKIMVGKGDKVAGIKTVIAMI